MSATVLRGARKRFARNGPNAQAAQTVLALVEEVAGSIKSGVGDLIDDKSMEVEGKAKELEGKARQALND